MPRSDRRGRGSRGHEQAVVVIASVNVGSWFDAGVGGVALGSATTTAARPDGDDGHVTVAAAALPKAVAEARR